MTDDAEARHREEVRQLEERVANAQRQHAAALRDLENQLAEARHRGLTDTDAYRQALQAMEMSRRVMAGETFALDALKAWGEAIFNPHPRH